MEDTLYTQVAQCYSAAIHAADPYLAVKHAVSVTFTFTGTDKEKEEATEKACWTIKVGENEKYEYDMSRYRHIYVAGSGKAAYGGVAAAVELIEAAGRHVDAGVVCIGYGCRPEGRGAVETVEEEGTLGHVTLPKLPDLPSSIIINEARHPVPDEASVHGAKLMLELLNKATDEDLVVYIATGGGSAIMALPADGLTLEDLQETNRVLLKSGATLPEMNYIRKHIDGVKGGQVARAAHPASLVTLVLSDVVGDPLDMVSSGPTVPDPHTFAEALGVVEKYSLGSTLPPAVVEHLKRGQVETPKEGDVCFKNSLATLVGGNRTCVNAVVDYLKSNDAFKDYEVIVKEEPIVGIARDVAAAMAKEVISISAAHAHAHAHTIIVGGGECTVKVTGNGRGGRNQEFALAMCLEMKDKAKQWICGSFATDGVDCIRESAGAVVDHRSLQAAKLKNCDGETELLNNNSYAFHVAAGTLIPGKPSGTNCCDVYLVLL